MFTLPVMVTLPEVESRAPPLRVAFPFTVSVFVPFVREPELTVREVAVSWLDWLRVPVTVTVANDWPAASVTVFAAPVKVTDEDVLVKGAAVEVFHEPAMAIVADPKEAVAAPLEVRFPLKVGVEEVSVNVPDQVREDANVVVTPGLTVRLFTVWGTLTVPAEADTTIVEVPGVRVPADVSMDVTVMTLARAFRAPFVPTVNVPALMARLAAEVSRVVVGIASLTCTVPALSARDAIVNVCAIPAEEANTTVENSFPLRLLPAKVIVPPVAEVKITVAVPADQEADVELSVHVPANVHDAPPKLK